MRILFALAGLHRVNRGAEIAFISIASQLARGGDAVTLIGSGPSRTGTPYRYLRAASIRRERFEHWPSFPMLRNETGWEEATFVPGLLGAYDPAEYDVTITCSYPWTSLALRRPARGRRPAHVFVTQNGDWPAVSNSSEFRLFSCEGLVCTNPEFYERNRDRYRAALIPNGVDTELFRPGPGERERLGLPPGGPIVLMVSAFISSKNIDRAVHAVSHLEDATLVVAGDGPLRDEIAEMARRLLPDRYRQLTVGAQDMPALYRSADAFLHLSRDESFGNVFVEAMACGIPIVAYDLPNTRWIVGSDSCLVDAEAPEAIAAQLRAAIAQKSSHNPALVNRAATFDWANVASQYRKFLAKVTARQ